MVKKKKSDLDVPRTNSMRMLCLQLECVNPDVGCRSCICGGNGDEVAGEVRGMRQILSFCFFSYETSLKSVLINNSANVSSDCQNQPPFSWF